MSLTASKKAFNGNEAFAKAFVEGMHSVRDWSRSISTLECNIDVLNKHLGQQIKRGDYVMLAHVLGTPEQLLRLQEAIFYGLPHLYKRVFPRDFAHALAECTDITYIWQRQILWLLREEMAQFRCNELDMVATLYDRWVGGNRPTDDEFSDAVHRLTIAIDKERSFIWFALYVLKQVALAGVGDDHAIWSATFHAAIAMSQLVEENRQQDEQYKSYQRQGDNLLNLLRGEAR